MYKVALAEQQLGKIGAILSGDAGDESNFVSHGSLAVVFLSMWSKTPV